jgi:putative holliday junction resolvase
VSAAHGGPQARAKRESGPEPGRARVCALDPGRARIGVAVDDELGLLAHPRGTLDPRDPRALAEELRALAERENVRRFVVGLPLHLKGGEGTSAREARRLAQLVADTTGCLVELWDERLSTVQASRALAASEVRGKKARAHIDEAAACAILQSWLDAQQSRRKER